jgi:hypothetical protein
MEIMMRHRGDIISLLEGLESFFLSFLVISSRSTVVDFHYFHRQRDHHHYSAVIKIAESTLAAFSFSSVLQFDCLANGGSAMISLQVSRSSSRCKIATKKKHSRARWRAARCYDFVFPILARE